MINKKRSGGSTNMDKKNILTYQGLQKLENELQDLKVVKEKRDRDKKSKKHVSRVTYPRTLSTMPPKRLKVSWRLSLRS